MRRVFVLLVFPLLLISGQATPAGAAGIRAAKPTHYFVTPKPYVNPPWHLVASLHEISYSFPQNLQFQLSLLDAIGRIKFGIKFGINENLALGAGLSSYWGYLWFSDHHRYWDRHYDYYHRYYYHNPHARLGIFLSTGRGRGGSFEWSITPNIQLGDPIGLGCDFGLMATPSAWWSIIGEIGGSLELDYGYHPWFWFFTDGGVRIHPPTVPYLMFDLGFGVGAFDWNPGFSVYFDVIFAMITH
ncbi:MAG: hypothetical protein GF344_12870 [Chitinivibrionales bacterium]|nr:hypothetical protein [Chitinivibrionales bacterium]MBD3357635.1 hypothetical protein [Chitinivibrionales bacterium]